MSAWKHAPRHTRKTDASAFAIISLWLVAILLILIAMAVIATAAMPTAADYMGALNLHPDCPTSGC